MSERLADSWRSLEGITPFMGADGHFNGRSEMAKLRRYDKVGGKQTLQ